MPRILRVPKKGRNAGNRPDFCESPKGGVAPDFFQSVKRGMSARILSVRKGVFLNPYRGLLLSLSSSKNLSIRSSSIMVFLGSY